MTDPRFLSVKEWCDFTCVPLSALAPPPKLLDVERWREWALVVIAIPAVAIFNPPNPHSFVDWREWAERFVECVLL